MTVVVISTADIDAAVWTNKQYLAVGLADAGHEVVYVESLGLRRPRLDRADLRRLLHGALRRLRPRRADPDPRLPAALTVLAPQVLPLPGLAIARAINRRALRRQIRGALDGSTDAVLWTFSPVTYGVEDLFTRVVYHSVDLLHTVPHVPEHVLLSDERSLLRRADVVIASSSGVRDHLTAQGADDVLLWTNVANVATFQAALPGTVRSRAAVFAGHLTPTKIDLAAMRSVIECGLTLDIAGPIGLDGTGNDAELLELVTHPGVRYHGLLDLEGLARLLADCRVGLIPYHLNEYTAGVFPMKVYEYLAAGLEVVSTALPSLLHDEQHRVRVVEPDEFGTTAAALACAFDPDEASERSRAAETHSWSSRIREAEHLLGLMRSGSTSESVL